MPALGSNRRLCLLVDRALRALLTAIVVGMPILMRPGTPPGGGPGAEVDGYPPGRQRDDKRRFEMGEARVEV